MAELCTFGKPANGVTAELAEARRPWWQLFIGVTISIIIFPNIVLGQQNSGVAFLSGNELRKYCSGSVNERNMCLGYIMAIADTMDIEQISLRKSCIPFNTDIELLVDVVMKWLDNNPKKSQWLGYLIVAEAFKDTFPCP